MIGRRSPARRAGGLIAGLALAGAACSQPSADVSIGDPTTSRSVARQAEHLVESDPTSEATTTELSPTTTSEPSTPAPPSPPAGPPPSNGVNIYADIATPNPVTADAQTLVYVPHEVSGDVWVIDPATFQVVRTFPTGAESQHVVPSWDMTTLYTVSGRGARITPIDPTTGEPGAAIPVADPYNLYFTPDGSEAIVVAEGEQRLDFRDPHTFALHSSLQTSCYGINHMDYTVDYRYLVATCEFDGSLIRIDMASRTVVNRLAIDMRPSGKRPRNGHAQPQDVRLSADGTVFYVADLQSDGVYVIDATLFTQTGFIPTGVGAHGLYPSRDGTKLYVVNRGTNIVGGPPRGQGSVSVLDFASRTIIANWPVPGGGSPDMGNLTFDGRQLWLGGRYDREVYVFDTTTGTLAARIPVGTNPHGLTVWPQPGRFSLGHTGNMR